MEVLALGWPVVTNCNETCLKSIIGFLLYKDTTYLSILLYPISMPDVSQLKIDNRQLIFDLFLTDFLLIFEMFLCVVLKGGGMYTSFKDMPVWKRAMGIAERIYKLTEPLPKKEDYGLTSQIRRSSLSMPASIAEAFGRKHIKEKINFYTIASGSLTETQSHLEYGRRVGYFDEVPALEIEVELNALSVDIRKIVLALKRSVAGSSKG